VQQEVRAVRRPAAHAAAEPDRPAVPARRTQLAPPQQVGQEAALPGPRVGGASAADMAAIPVRLARPHRVRTTRAALREPLLSRRRAKR